MAQTKNMTVGTPSKAGKKSPREVLQKILNEKVLKKVTIRGIEVVLHPGVYPSHSFETTHALLEAIGPLVSNKIVCDFGCGMGIVGEFALRNNAHKVVMTDINPLAIRNASANKMMYNRRDIDLMIYESNCFDRVPFQRFDLIVFNAPIYGEPQAITRPIEWAFHDPNFQTIEKFLHQAKQFMFTRSQIIIGYSEKGSPEQVEDLFGKHGYKWTRLPKSVADSDSCIYALTLL
ncbi:MAG: Ribosomal RNA small subunit methyltransferase C [Chlamydiia bacterium]|nr:Ribosomal RNA small subunit methyltransferase C [Chlamydiia bacterium]